MVPVKSLNRCLILLLLCCLVVGLTGTAVYGAKERDKTQASEYRTTQIELQSELMSFGDRFGAILAQAVIDVEAQTPKPEIRLLVRSDYITSVSAAITIAAGPNPEVGLLDMVVLTTLGSMIHEEYWYVKFGAPIKPMLTAFKLLEKDIWLISAKVLTPEEQEELRSLIRNWRRQYPKQLIFSYIRFGDFAAKRHGPGTKQTGKPGGLFKAVKEATQKADEMLLLAERGLYLSARMPILANGMAQFGLMQMLMRPEVKQIMTDTNKLSEAMYRLANVTEKLPADLLQDLLLKEKGLRGLLSDVQQTLTAGNELMASTNSTLRTTSDLVARLGIDQSATNGRPIDMVALTGAVEQLNTLVASLGHLLESPGWEQRFPQLLQVLDKTELKGKDFVDHIFIRAIMLMLVFLLGSLITGLIYQYMTRRVFSTKT
ncbi:MAG: hypothetical protein U9R43_17410 [Thermodesulfobacteriota bacterium]|nr:hypothetical protein [Thermodesulfobacteriota bacterium]